MAASYTALVGTIGTGIWTSDDGGESWGRSKGIWNESLVYALTPHPIDPSLVFAGANDGLYRSADRGSTFERVGSSVIDRAVWSVAFDPSAPDTIFAGGRPGAVYRSQDGGQTWSVLSAEFAEECPNVRWPLVLSISVDPADGRNSRLRPSGPAPPRALPSPRWTAAGVALTVARRGPPRAAR